MLSFPSLQASNSTQVWRVATLSLRRWVEWGLLSETAACIVCESKHVHTCEQNTLTKSFFSLSIVDSRWSVLQDYSTHRQGTVLYKTLV